MAEPVRYQQIAEGTVDAEGRLVQRNDPSRGF